MVLCMKTTIEVADGLLEEAKQLAARRGSTLREVLEEGLRRELEEAQQTETAFRLRDASFGGNGMNPGFAEGGWQSLRDALYEEHGT